MRPPCWFFSLLVTACGSTATIVPAPVATSLGPSERIENPAQHRTSAWSPTRTREGFTWPTREQFAQTHAALAQRPPRTLAVTRYDGRPLLAAARRQGSQWMLDTLFDDEARPAGCPSLPCPWPASLPLDEPLEEPTPLLGVVIDAVAYARTLLAFEGPLRIPSEVEVEPNLPEAAWNISGEGELPNLLPYLEALRRYDPMGGCSMDTRPQAVSLMRATAAAQAGRTGWAVQGWVDSVGYWSSTRPAWSSYGQQHPAGHLALLDRVGVDPARLLLGLLIDLPNQEPVLHLSDIRRVVPDLGEAFATTLRALAADSNIDPLNRAYVFAAFAGFPFTGDPLYAQLPPESQALLSYWSR